MGNKVSAAKPKIGGAISVAPVGTALPTSATSTLSATFVPLGYISQEGLKNNPGFTSETIKAWGGEDVLQLDQGRTDTYTYKLIEALNEEVLKQVYGAENVTGTLTTGIQVEAKKYVDMPEQVMVIDMIMKGNVPKRIVIPRGVITNVEEIEYSDSATIGYNTTVNALADSDGVTHYEYIGPSGASA